MRFKRLGASMLTGALSLSMLLGPSISTLAYTADREDTTGTYAAGTALVDIDEKVLYKFTKQEIEEMAANNTKEYRDICDKYGDPSGWDTVTIEGKKYYVKTLTYYKNTITGKSSTDAEDVVDADELGMPKNLAVNTGAYTYIELQFNAGNVGIKDLKSSKKKIATATISDSSKTITNENQTPIRDIKDKDKYYYYGAYGEKVYVKDPDAIINNSHGTVRIRIKGLKKGSSVLSFKVVNKDNKVTATKKITVKVKDTQPFAKLTYNGKSLIYNPVLGEADKNYIYAGNNLDKDASLSSYGYTTKAKGKLYVKMNKDYKLVKIEVGKLFNEKYNSLTVNSNKSTYAAGKLKKTQYTDASQFDSYSGNYKNSHYVDLNGDGDYLDTVNGIDETDVDFKYTTIRNNSTITLSKVTYDTSYKSKEYNDNAILKELKRDAQGNAVKDENDEYVYNYTLIDPNDYTSSSNSSSSMYAPTAVRITYFDMAEKAYKIFSDSIWYRVKK